MSNLSVASGQSVFKSYASKLDNDISKLEKKEKSIRGAIDKIGNSTVNSLPAVVKSDYIKVNSQHTEFPLDVAVQVVKNKHANINHALAKLGQDVAAGRELRLKNGALKPVSHNPLKMMFKNSSYSQQKADARGLYSNDGGAVTKTSLQTLSNELKGNEAKLSERLSSAKVRGDDKQHETLTKDLSKTQLKINEGNILYNELKFNAVNFLMDKITERLIIEPNKNKLTKLTAELAQRKQCDKKSISPHDVAKNLLENYLKYSDNPAGYQRQEIKSYHQTKSESLKQHDRAMGRNAFPVGDEHIKMDCDENLKFVGGIRNENKDMITKLLNNHEKWQGIPDRDSDKDVLY